tara:strand:- start:133 stop:363 length:231 start_codon:yes stop_codon:yes gene_type:complete
MKKLLFSLSVVFALSSCSEKECNCGTIANDGIDGECYWLEIRNSCSENKKTFCFDQDVWQEAYVGESFCVTGEESW